MNKVLLTATAVIFSLSSQVVFAAEKTYIIGFHKKHGNTEKRLIEGRKGKIKKSLEALPVVIADLAEEDAAALLQDASVAYVEENVFYSLPVAPVSKPSEYTSSWGVETIGAEAAHLRGITGMGVKVGILDSGIDATHPDLAANYKGGTDIVFNDSIPNDENGHGTHIAGIIAAKGNGSGFVGVAPDADIYAIRILDGGGGGSSAWLLSGIDWAILNNMNVVNISNGTPFSLVSLQDAFQRAYAAGMVVVAAAGNGAAGGPGKDLSLSPVYPACYDTVIAVSATDSADLIASWSNYGSKVELAAPGANVTSTYLAGGTATLSGTSQAAPHVVGAAALLLSAGVTDANGDGNLVDEVRQALGSTARDLGVAGRDSYYGFGLVNASWIGGTPTDPQPQTETFTLSGGTAAPVAKVLAAGSYTIEIANQELDRIKIARSSVRNRTWSMTLRFSRRSPVTTTVDVVVTSPEEKFSFTACGSVGTSATITIRKN